MRSTIGCALALLPLLLVGACADLHENLDRGVAVVTGAPPADQAYVVVGVAVKKPLTKLLVSTYDVSLGWIGYDPATQRRRSGDAATAPWTVVRCTALTVNCSGQPNYSVLAVPPGDYALAWIDSGDREWLFADFANHRTARSGDTTYPVVLSADATVRPHGMRFTVHPGEAVYVGDVAFDLQAAEGGALALDRGETNDAARAALADHGIKAPLVVRPWRDGDGGPAMAAR